MRCLVSATCIAVLSLVVACQKSSDPGGSYTVRGEVRSLTTAGPGEIQIHHEAIPDFVDRDGHRVGMASMSMPFGIHGAAVGDVSPGDKVEFTFEVHWNARPTVQIVRIAKLAPETPLTLTGL